MPEPKKEWSVPKAIEETPPGYGYNFFNGEYEGPKDDLWTQIMKAFREKGQPAPAPEEFQARPEPYEKQSGLIQDLSKPMKHPLQTPLPAAPELPEPGPRPHASDYESSEEYAAALNEWERILKAWELSKGYWGSNFGYQD